MTPFKRPHTSLRVGGMWQFLGPILLALVVVGGSVWWALGEEDRALERVRRRTRRHVNSLSQGLQVVMAKSNVQNKEAQDQLLRQQLSQHLRLGPPIHFVTLARQDHIVVHLGMPFEHPMELGLHQESSTWVMRKSMADRPHHRHLQADDCASQPKRTGPPWRWVDCERRHEFEPPLTLYVGVRSGFPPGRRQEVRHRTWRTLALIWLGLGVVCGAWVLRVRGKRLRQVLREERRRKQQLEDLNLAAAGLAHETRNPLGLILGLAQRLAADPEVSARAKNVAEQIVDEADRATARLSDFLNFASVKSPHLEEVEASELVAQVVEVLRPDFETKGVDVVLEIEEEVVVMADASMLQQVLLNLLLNSLSASEAGSCTKVRLRARGDVASLVVEDEGGGIDPAISDDIFKPYVTGSPQGHGLGLAVVARVVEGHGWQIEMTSSGEGTRCTIEGIRRVT